MDASQLWREFLNAWQWWEVTLLCLCVIGFVVVVLWDRHITRYLIREQEQSDILFRWQMYDILRDRLDRPSTNNRSGKPAPEQEPAIVDARVIGFNDPTGEHHGSQRR